MRATLRIYSLIIGIFLLNTSNGYASVDGQAAPDFVINTPQLTGSLTGLQGKVIYVDFWASWCKPCRKSFPWMNDMQAKYPKDLQIIAINLDAEPELAAAFLAKVPATMPIIYDPQGDIAKAYQLLGMPSSYLIDKKGKLRFAHKGFFSEKEALYENEISTLLNEQE
ncbi:TlpA disulfide reductase family protein [Paraglaciecola sp.]|uniref:TlpA family protein disulfide reductase n=1 Tax=Paraglaciecola sp. TaxID=1920173 RepID=UPI0030F4255F